MNETRRVAVVVGTGPDIGRACALELGASGAVVVCADRDEAAARATAQALGASGFEAGYVVVDATDRHSVRAAFAQVLAAHGRLDVVVDVVGGASWSPLTETSDEEWDRVFALNLRQQWIVAQEVLGLLTPNIGALVPIASVSGMMAAPGHGAYGAAKAGLINLVATLAVEHASRGVRVNAVAPGATATAARAADAELAARIPLGRRADPREIGAVAAFLASDAAGYITGQVIVVDGGASVKHALHGH